MKIFAKNMEDNIIVIATFADAGEPQVLNAIKEAKIPINHVSKFNNSALFTTTGGNQSKINQLFWEIGESGYKTMFKSICLMEPKS